jgi:hypothetical protein
MGPGGLQADLLLRVRRIFPATETARGVGERWVCNGQTYQTSTCVNQVVSAVAYGATYFTAMLCRTKGRNMGRSGVARCQDLVLPDGRTACLPSTRVDMIGERIQTRRSSKPSSGTNTPMPFEPGCCGTCPNVGVPIAVFGKFLEGTQSRPRRDHGNREDYLRTCALRLTRLRPEVTGCIDRRIGITLSDGRPAMRHRC